jgi:hypothetical protein
LRSGAIYPFVESEGMLAIAGVISRRWWHVKQAEIEDQQFKEDVEKYGNKEALAKLVSQENSSDP